MYMSLFYPRHETVISSENSSVSFFWTFTSEKNKFATLHCIDVVRHRSQRLRKLDPELGQTGFGVVAVLGHAGLRRGQPESLHHVQGHVSRQGQESQAEGRVFRSAQGRRMVEMSVQPASADRL